MYYIGIDVGGTNLVSGLVRNVRVILSGEINRSVTVNGLVVTKGAKAAIESKGGKVA